MVPCKHNYSGEAKIAEFFEPMISQNSDGTMDSALYGNKLVGETVKIHSTSGLIEHIWCKLRSLRASESTKWWRGTTT